MGTYFQLLQLAKELDLWEDVVTVIIMKVVDSEFWHLPSQALWESELTSSWTLDWFSSVLKQDDINAHAQWKSSWTLDWFSSVLKQDLINTHAQCHTNL